jgi:hypothetical protein
MPKPTVLNRLMYRLPLWGISCHCLIYEFNRLIGRFPWHDTRLAHFSAAGSRSMHHMADEVCI